MKTKETIESLIDRKYQELKNKGFKNLRINDILTNYCYNIIGVYNENIEKYIDKITEFNNEK